jgi:cyclic beta-1,2-glucan synthetase
MYRAGLEAILGITREGAAMRVKPCIPDDWDQFEVVTQFGATRYEIRVSRGIEHTGELSPDVQVVSPCEFRILLKDEGGVRKIEVPLPALKP